AGHGRFEVAYPAWRGGHTRGGFRVLVYRRAPLRRVSGRFWRPVSGVDRALPRGGGLRLVLAGAGHQRRGRAAASALGPARRGRGRQLPGRSGLVRVAGHPARRAGRVLPSRRLPGLVPLLRRRHAPPGGPDDQEDHARHRPRRVVHHALHRRPYLVLLPRVRGLGHGGRGLGGSPLRSLVVAVRRGAALSLPRGPLVGRQAAVHGLAHPELRGVRGGRRPLPRLQGLRHLRGRRLARHDLGPRPRLPGAGRPRRRPGGLRGTRQDRAVAGLRLLVRAALPGGPPGRRAPLGGDPSPPAVLRGGGRRRGLPLPRPARRPRLLRLPAAHGRTGGSGPQAGGGSGPLRDARHRKAGRARRLPDAPRGPGRRPPRRARRGRAHGLKRPARLARDGVPGLAALRGVADLDTRRGGHAAPRVPPPPAGEVRGVLRDKDPRGPPGPAGRALRDGDRRRLPVPRRGVLERRQALGRRQPAPGVPAGGRPAHRARPGRRARLRPHEPSTRPGPRLHAPARARGRGGIRRHLRPRPRHHGPAQVQDPL
ncbi:MAG: hypothetical protein AVDCRST_MAG02-3951, partial [uncultured Rubrobacteraceae bacterium]